MKEKKDSYHGENVHPNSSQGHENPVLLIRVDYNEMGPVQKRAKPHTDLSQFGGWI